MQPKGVTNPPETVAALGDWDVAVLQVKAGGCAGDLTAHPVVLLGPGCRDAVLQSVLENEILPFGRGY